MRRDCRGMLLFEYLFISIYCVILWYIYDRIYYKDVVIILIVSYIFVLIY